MERLVRLPFARNLQFALVVMMLVGLLGTTGCSWFRRGQDSASADVPAAVATDMTPAPQDTLPVDQPEEGPRPGDLTPLPEMRVIYFDYDRATLRPDQLANAQQNLRFLQENPEIKVMITGHCDERGSIEYNFNLGMRRASSVQDYYVQNGIPANRIAIGSKGEEEPAVLGTGEQAWARNRRAEFHRMH